MSAVASPAPQRAAARSAAPQVDERQKRAFVGKQTQKKEARSSDGKTRGPPWTPGGAGVGSIRWKRARSTHNSKNTRLTKTKTKNAQMEKARWNQRKGQTFNSPLVGKENRKGCK